MSFSEKTKNELARLIPEARCCKIAELSAFYDFNGFLLGNNNYQYLDFYHSSPVVARKILLLLKGLVADIKTQVLVKRTKAKNHMCTVRVLDLVEAQFVYSLMNKRKFLDEQKRVPFFKCCRRSYLRGAFLSQGSIADPGKTYHFEISIENTEVAARVFETMNSLLLEPKIMMRKANHVIYLKDGEKIVEVLNNMGAHNALLKLENVRVIKDMRNQVNRLVNCETANVDKTVKAAMKQVAEIQKIEDTIGITKLPEKLQEIARLRLANPYASLKELGELADPPMSKSGVNYRMKQLLEISKEIDEGQ